MITKTNYRGQVRELLLQKMRTGVLKPNQSLSLAGLARELEVSVTPIREALSQLQQAKIIESIPNRGFIIPELSADEAKNLYEIVANLEVLAIQNSSFNNSILNKLKKQQQVFEKSKSGIDRINADMDFHEVLVSKYKNPIALQILSELKTRIFFYEMKFMNNADFHEDSEHHHHKIIEYLETNHINKASSLLIKNWLQILNHIK